MLSCARSLGANQRLYLTIAAGYKMTTEVLIAVAFSADFHRHSLVPFACRNWMAVSFPNILVLVLQQKMKLELNSVDCSKHNHQFTITKDNKSVLVLKVKQYLP